MPLLPEGTTIDGALSAGQQLKNLLGAGGRFVQNNARPLMQAGVGAGLLGLGKVTHNQILGGLGGAALGNIPGHLLGAQLSDFSGVEIPRGYDVPSMSMRSIHPMSPQNLLGFAGAIGGGGLGYAATKPSGLDQMKDRARGIVDRLNPNNWTPEGRNAVLQGGLGAAALGAGHMIDSRALGALGGGLLGGAAGSAVDGNSNYEGHAGQALGTALGAGLGAGVGYDKKQPEQKEAALSLPGFAPLKASAGQFLSANRGQIGKGLLGAGLLGAGHATHSGVLGAMGGGLLGNSVGNLAGSAAGNGFQPSTGLGGYGGVLGASAGSAAGYAATKEDPSLWDTMKAKLGSHYAQGYADALTKLGFASMLAPLAGALAGPGIRAGLGKVAPRMAGKFSGPIRSGVFDAVAGQAAGSLMAPSAPTAPG